MGCLSVCPLWVCFTLVSSVFGFSVLGIEARTSWVLSTCSATELCQVSCVCFIALVIDLVHVLLAQMIYTYLIDPGD
jgi:hypothetical protein